MRAEESLCRVEGVIPTPTMRDLTQLAMTGNLRSNYLVVRAVQTLVGWSSYVGAEGEV